MKSLKITLIGLVALLTVAVGYGYGCGGGDDSGSGEATTAAESKDGSTSATTADSGDGESSGKKSGDGGGSGGGGGASDGGGSPLSKAEFIKKGDTICATVPAEYGKNVVKLEEENKKQGKPKPSPAEVNLKAAVPPLYPAIEQFEELSPPKGEEAKAKAIVAALEAAAKGLEEKPSSQLTGPKSPFGEFQKLTKEYGFQFCPQL